MEAGRRLAGLAFRGMLMAGKELALLPGDNGRVPTAWSTLHAERGSCHDALPSAKTAEFWDGFFRFACSASLSLPIVSQPERF